MHFKTKFDIMRDIVSYESIISALLTFQLRQQLQQKQKRLQATLPAAESNKQKK